MDLNDYEKYNTKITTITIPYALWLKAKQNLISFAEASTFGVCFMLAEKGLMNFPKNSLSNEIEELQSKIEKLQGVITKMGEEKDGND